jgi:hypothetical protein
MTSKKQLKAKIRARMARTGERYVAARRHVVGDAERPATAVTDHGWTLRGGQHPDSAALANVLAHHGVTAGHTGEPVSEALVFGLGGGLGAGYILWEFTAHDARILVLGFAADWQYFGRFVRAAADRLGVPVDAHQTSGIRGAAGRLTQALLAGKPSLVWPDRFRVGYWHQPTHLDGHGGHPVVAYALDGARVHVDDRTLAPLTVPAATLDDARDRVVSYKNLLLTPRPDAGEIPADRLREQVRSAAAACAARLAGTSASFALPAWRKWGRTMTDARNAKGWPKVFADRRGLVGALLSIWEGVEPMGMAGGHLRGLYADFLDEAADLTGTPALYEVAARFRDIAADWHTLAETAVPASGPTFGRMRELTSTISESVFADGDTGAEDAAAAAGELWSLRAEHDRTCPLSDGEIESLFAAVGKQVTGLYEAELAAVRRLAAALE